MKCQACNSRAVYEVDTYKHVWHFCDDCGSAFRTRKEVYPFTDSKLNGLAPVESIIKDPSTIYDYFGGSHMDKVGLSSFSVFSTSIIDKQRLDFFSRSVLDISGDNGFFVKQFEQQFGCRVAVTEYNAKGVEYARTVHGLRAEIYDINTEDLSSKFDEYFDYILMRTIMPFCTNSVGFALQALQRLNKGGLLICTGCVFPNLAPVLRWMLDDYTYNALYQPEYLTKLFQERGFELFLQEEDTFYPYDRGWDDDMKAFAKAYENRAFETLFRSARKDEFANLQHRHLTLIFRKP